MASPFRLLASLVAAAGLAGCDVSIRMGGGLDGSSSAPPVFDPDVPAWRGGCFFEGGPGKVVNAVPSPDVRIFGDPCTPGGTGGLVYLDRFDLTLGTGDVTVLSAAAGSRPRVVGTNGGTGGTFPGSTGARFDAAQATLLTLADVGFITGRLVRVPLPEGEPVTVDQNVRVENYDFLPGGAVLYVGNYTPAVLSTDSTGDLIVWQSGATRTVDTGVSRFDFVMYRLDRGMSRVAYLKKFGSQGGELYLTPLDGTPAGPSIDVHVQSMAFAQDGTLVYRRWVPDDPAGSDLLIRRPGDTQSTTVAPHVNVVSLFGNSLVYENGWALSTRTAALFEFTTGAPIASTSALTFAGVRRGATLELACGEHFDPDTGLSDLLLALIPAGPTTVTTLDTGISPMGGFFFSPRGDFLAYTKGFSQPVTPSDPSAQPGVAAELWFTPVWGGSPVRLATQASTQLVAWAGDDSALAALADFVPGSNAGRLVAMPTDGTATWFEGGLTDGVASSGFAFGESGFESPIHLAAIHGWNDALQTGALVMSPVPPDGAGLTPVDEDVAFLLPPRGNRILYGVRGNGRDGLWLGVRP